MLALSERLKNKIDVLSDDDVDSLLSSAKSLYLSLKYPYNDFGDDPPPLGNIAEDWVLRCAVEMYDKEGGSGQVSHNENGISRSWDSGTVSKSLRMEVIPVSGLVRA